MDKINGNGLNISVKNIKIIRDLFPQAFADGDINFNSLKCLLNCQNETEEKYSFNWNGKSNSIRNALSASKSTLLLDKSDSVDYNFTDNCYIVGDNLEVLKTLTKTYYNSIKMIYIDPPYNTGEDFIYNDDFSNNTSDYISKTEQNYRSNPETSGRFHTNWLNMMYPRLMLAYNLLKDEGVIFISIDDNEVANLRKICDEIFEESNFIGQFIWQNKKGGGNDSIHLAIEHEYVICYAKNKDLLGEFYESYSEEYSKRYKERDEIGRFYWDTFKRKSGKQYYPITCPDGTVLQYDEDGNPISWLRSKDRFDSDVAKGEIRIQKINDKWSVQFKQRMPEGKKPRSILNINQVIQDKGTTSTGSDDVYAYFKKDVFSNPKPIALIEYFIEFGMSDNDIIMDFFSGSGTTADAVMRANVKDNGHRKFILVQLDEKIKKPEDVSNANAKRINSNAIDYLDSIGKEHLITNLAIERLKKARLYLIERIKKNDNSLNLFDNNSINYDSLDLGFKVFKLESSNIKAWDSSLKLDETSLLDQLETIKEDRTNLDVAYEIMLKYGVFNMPLEEVKINNKTMFNVGKGFLIIDLNSDTTLDDVEAIGKEKPHCVVFKESGFKDDNAKLNAVKTLETFGVQDIKCL